MTEALSKFLEGLPDDFFATQNLFTTSFYRDEYPAIKPEDPRLSQKGKVVVITGASSGIGQRVSIEFLLFFLTVRADSSIKGIGSVICQSRSKSSLSCRPHTIWVGGDSTTSAVYKSRCQGVPQIDECHR